MPYVKAKDGVDIYYEVAGQGTPLLFLSETSMRWTGCTTDRSQSSA